MIYSILETPHPNTDKIYLFLDNDKAGNKATQELTDHFSQFFKVLDCRYLYQKYKDFNEAISK
jgi:5S rRNA maturation endonuclease (ribonuclease M5)